jgi:DNA polymerase-3 subunit delta'
LKPFEGKFKIMLIWLAEYMNAAAANSLLKILEEPAENTVFLLVTNDEKKILPTIRSRTQVVWVRPFSDENIKKMLVENHFIEDDKARQISHLVDGNILEALRLAREVEDDSHVMFRDWMRLCFLKNMVELVKWTDRYSKLSRVSQQTLLQYGLSMMRESLILLSNEPSLSRLMGPELEFIKNFIKVLDIEMIEDITQELNDAIYHLERNANAKILFLDLSLRIIETFNHTKSRLQKVQY